MTIEEFRDYLQDIIDELRYYDDDQEINVSCSTYGLSDYFISTSKGYIDLCNIVDEQ